MAIVQNTFANTGLALSRLGFGAAPLGNLYQELHEKDAQAAVASALKQGITYFDTAPLYGFGLSERRLGRALQAHPEAVISTKVGRLLVPAPEVLGAGERQGFYSDLPFKPVFDYSYRGIMKSHEASLERLGLKDVDILYVHDVGQLTHGERHDAMFRQLFEGRGMAALVELRATGAIKAFGVGVNETQICLEVMEHARIDLILLAGRYTLLEQGALDQLLPTCASQQVGVVVGGPYNSGILATGTRHGGVSYYDYAQAPRHIVERVQRIEKIADRHEVSLAAAALQFPLAHPCVASVIPGVESAERILQNLALIDSIIPGEFWQDLKLEGLLTADAPVPEAVR